MEAFQSASGDTDVKQGDLCPIDQTTGEIDVYSLRITSFHKNIDDKGNAAFLSLSLPPSPP